MKQIGIMFVVLLISFFAGAQEAADSAKKVQEDNDSTKIVLNTPYIIQEFSGDVFVGLVVYEDPRMIKLQVKKIGVIAIRKNDIEVIKAYNKHLMSVASIYIPDEVFSTRYFLTSNALPVKPKENFAAWNWYGPDLHKTVARNFDASVNTTWGLMPLIGNLQLDIPMGHRADLGVGSMFGWGSWGYQDCYGAIPYASLTVGSRINNVTLSAGYGYLSLFGAAEERSMLSIALMQKTGSRTTLVFDSFFLPASATTDQTIDVIMGGIRFQSDSKSAFQVGIGALSIANEFLPAPIPFATWFRKI